MVKVLTCFSCFVLFSVGSWRWRLAFDLVLLCFVWRARILLLFMGSGDPPKGEWIWDQSGNHYNSLLTSSKHYKRYFELRKDPGMEEERSSSWLYYQILCFSPRYEQVNCLKEEKHESCIGARKRDGSRCSLRIWCLALLFNRYGDNVPRFPGTRRILHPLSL